MSEHPEMVREENYCSGVQATPGNGPGESATSRTSHIKEKQTNWEEGLVFPLVLEGKCKGCWEEVHEGAQ